ERSFPDPQPIGRTAQGTWLEEFSSSASFLVLLVVERGACCLADTGQLRSEEHRRAKRRKRNSDRQNTAGSYALGFCEEGGLATRFVVSIICTKVIGLYQPLHAFPGP